MLGLLTSKQHLLQQIINDNQSVVLSHLDLVHQQPCDALQTGQRQQYLAEPTAGLVLTVAHVVFHVHLHLKSYGLDTAAVADAPSIC